MEALVTYLNTSFRHREPLVIYLKTALIIIIIIVHGYTIYIMQCTLYKVHYTIYNYITHTHTDYIIYY